MTGNNGEDGPDAESLDVDAAMLEVTEPPEQPASGTDSHAPLGDRPDEAAALKASDSFVDCLEAEGVTHIFGVPGEENADLMMSLIDSDIEFVLCRHEQAAAFMADAYGRLTGRPGVCLATLGPGATNLVTGIADANMDRSPVVAFIGQASTSRLHKESHQNMDAIGMLKPISKWSHSITNPSTIPEIVRKAFEVAAKEKPGACVIELPEDVAKARIAATPMVAGKTRRPAADHKAVARAVDLIAAAKYPIILAGNGAVRKRAATQLRRLAHKANASDQPYVLDIMVDPDELLTPPKIQPAQAWGYSLAKLKELFVEAVVNCR